MLLHRIITAIVLLALVIAGIFYLPPLFFVTICAIVIAIAGWEMASFFWPKNFLLKNVFVGSLLVLIFLSEFCPPLISLAVGALWWFSVPYFLIKFTRTGENYFTTPALRFLLGFLTFIPCFTGLIALRFDFGAIYLLFVLAIVWAADIGAYFAGRFFGKRLLAEHISPKKTVEGLLGGIGAALIIAIIAGFMLGLTLVAWVVWLLLVVVVVLWSVVGDLFESMLKRIANVKDSGTILPGHGGFFDRIDSLTSAIPIFALGLLLLRIQ